jgi:hypothetical protein
MGMLDDMKDKAKDMTEGDKMDRLKAYAQEHNISEEEAKERLGMGNKSE